MKKLSFVLATLVVALFTSCSSDSNSKMISPTATEFTSGELAKYIEIVDAPSELTYAEKDGVIPSQYIRLKVTLKLKKNGIRNVDPQDLDFSIPGVIINLVDEAGTTIVDISLKHEEFLKLKKLLIGNEGDTAEIVFEGEFHNSDDAPNWFKNAVQFTPYLSGDIIINSNNESYDSFESDNENIDDGEDYSFSSSGSEDWDALLDSYESYVTKYISYVKKAASGDVNALSEYPALLEKAQEFCSKMEGAQGEMSGAQWSRYMKITNKMTTAAMEMP